MSTLSLRKIKHDSSAVDNITLDSSGQVGINVTPSAPLTVGRVNSVSEGGQIDLCRSTDNASSWGIDVYGNTSTPSLRFVDNTASATRMQIDGSGRVTMPYQPAVHAGLTGVSVSGNTTANPIIWNSVLTNIGGHYNSSTGLFTCPVAGVYEVFASACVQVSGNGGWNLNVRKNGSNISAEYGKGFFELYGNPFSGYPMMTIRMLVSCSANDTLAVGGTVYREPATAYSTFNIALVS